MQLSFMIKPFSKYIGFTLNGMQEMYAYRFRAMISAVNAILLMLIQYYLWKAVFGKIGGSLFEITEAQYIAYLGIGLIVSQMTLCYQDYQISEEVRNGNIAMNLLRPFNYQGMIFARHVGTHIVNLINLIPCVLVVVFVADVSFTKALTFFLFLLSLTMSFFLSFFFCYIMGLITFWITNSWGLFLFRHHLAPIFSGQLMAIDVIQSIGREGISQTPITWISEETLQSFFYFMGQLCYWLPFQAMYYTPSAIYTGILKDPSAINNHLALQFFWMVFFFGLTHLVWYRAQKRITIFGG